MARYIKTDILAKIVFDKWQECDELKHIIPAIRNAVMCASTADVVEVVRCKDCKFYDFWERKGIHLCVRWSGDPYEAAEPGEDDFCSFAERRTDDGET